MTTAGEICERDVIATTADTTVAEAARLMRAQHVGSIVVIERANGGLPIPCGMVSDRDLVVEVMAVRLDPSVITVGDIMSRELVAVRGDESALRAMELMRVKGVRRLPVINEHGHLLGLVAFDDLLDLVLDQLATLTRIAECEQAHEAAMRR